MKTTASLTSQSPIQQASVQGKVTTNPLQPKAADNGQGFLQLAGEEKEPLQKKENPLQLKYTDDNPLKPVTHTGNPLQQALVQKKENKTGLPDQLKAGVENLSGYAMDDVKVHYNSSQPAQLNALAYAQGTDIHVAPGQEKHLPHEAWHVAQQMQGRVQPTMQMKGGIAVNDDKGLENEADVMGEKAVISFEYSQIPASQIHAANKSTVQARFAATEAAGWMQDINDEKLLSKFGSTTASLWGAMRDSGELVIVHTDSSGASFNFETKVLSVSSDWLAAIKKYIDSGEKADLLGRALSALTHELSHAHDHFEKDETPKGKSKATDAYVTAVLKTELKAWMKEARSARENSKDKGISAGDGGNDIINSWLGVHFLLKDGKDILTIDTSKNLVVGRLAKYFNDNKSTTTTTTLKVLLDDASNGLMANLVDFSKQIRDKYTSADSVLRTLAADTMLAGT